MDDIFHFLFHFSLMLCDINFQIWLLNLLLPMQKNEKTENMLGYASLKQAVPK